MKAETKPMGAGRRQEPPWTPRGATGLARVDALHEELFDRARELGEALRAGDRALAGILLSSIERQAAGHFREEEDCLRQIGCGHVVLRIAHERFIREFGELKRVFEAGGPSIAVAVKAETWLIDWLEGHVAWIAWVASLARKAQGVLPAPPPLSAVAHREPGERAPDASSGGRAAEERSGARPFSRRLLVLLSAAAVFLLVAAASWAVPAWRRSRLGDPGVAAGRAAAARLPGSGESRSGQPREPETEPRVANASPPAAEGPEGNAAALRRTHPDGARGQRPPAAVGNGRVGERDGLVAGGTKATTARRRDGGQAWGAARWGMTVEDVLVAFPGQAVRLKEGGANGASVPAVAIDRARIASRPSSARFYFDSSGRLVAVQIRPRESADALREVYDEIAAWLVEQYGTPAASRAEDPGHGAWARTATWRSHQTDVELQGCEGFYPPPRILYVDLKRGEITRFEECGLSVVLRSAAR